MSDFTEYVYTLSDPRDGSVRYVGITTNVRSRYSTHTSVKKSGNPEKDAWMQELRQLGMKPTMHVIESITHPVPDEMHPANREKYWIGFYKRQGQTLFNKPHKSANIDMPIIFLDTPPYGTSLEDDNARLVAENAQLKAEIKRLEAVIQQIKQAVSF